MNWRPSEVHGPTASQAGQSTSRWARCNHEFSAQKIAVILADAVSSACQRWSFHKGRKAFTQTEWTGEERAS